MPNIEIHGIKKPQRAEELRNKIFNKVREFSIDLASEVVVTIVPDECVDLALRSKPFLRIISPGSDAVKISQLVQCLEALGTDMETLTIDRFIPGQKS